MPDHRFFAKTTGFEKSYRDHTYSVKMNFTKWIFDVQYE